MFVVSGRLSFSACWQRAHAIGAEDAPRAWSKHSKGSSAYEKKHGKSNPVTAPTPVKKPPPLVINTEHKSNKLPKKTEPVPEDDPELREFLEVMQPRQKTRLWTNDDIVGVEKLVISYDFFTRFPYILTPI